MLSIIILSPGPAFSLIIVAASVIVPILSFVTDLPVLFDVQVKLK